MKNLEEFIIDNTIYPFEDFSNNIELIEGINGKYYMYKDCSNSCIINEGSFNRLMDRLKNSDFIIMSAYRTTFSKKENIIRNRKLRGILNNHKMGVHQLVGHWREAPEGKEYNQAQQSELTDAIERSYVIARPDNMNIEDFKSFIINKCMEIDNVKQDAVVFHQKNDDYYVLYNNGNTEKIGTKLTLNKIGQAYSQYVKKFDIPFVFEGVECPSTNIGKQVFKMHNIQYCE